MKKPYMVLILIVVTGILAACSGVPAEDSPIDEPAIYAAAIRQLYTVDHTFGTQPNWPTVYVVQRTDDTVGTLESEPADSRILSADSQNAIGNALRGLPTEIVWITDRDEAPISNEDGMVDGGKAVIITFGNIHPQADGSVQLPASLYCGGLCATGMTYVIEQVDGVWKVTGTTGPVWMS